VTSPQFTSVSRAVRGSVTQTFSSTRSFTIPGEAPGVSIGPANPYPSTISVSGLTNGVITDVNLVLEDFSHTHPKDVDILLSLNDGRQALVMSDVIDGDDATDVDLTLDDEAQALLPETGSLMDGTFRPTNVEYYADTFAAPAPALDGNLALSVFDGANPNGTWHLWVMDNSDGDYGDLGGWALQITAEVAVDTVDEQVPTGVDEPLATGTDTKQQKKDKKKGKGKRRR
jgi:large repetitive protein